MAKLTLRIDFGPPGSVGHGKVRLLELVGENGSITQAGRAMGMSYRRAWLLIDTLNRTFREPVVTTTIGGRAGGGACLTPFGRELIARYRAMELVAHAALQPHLQALDDAIAPADTEQADAEQAGAQQADGPPPTTGD
jgi:molybdate transport system regulatory protein